MVAHTRLVLSLLVCVPLAACLASPARAEVIFESALFNSVYSGATPVDDETFLGVRFELTETVTTGSIGGHFGGFPGDTFTQNIFGAVVQLDSFQDFPDSIDLSTPDVLGAALIPIEMPTSDVSANLDLTLEPGIYGLVFGSGLFGATGRAGARGQTIFDGDSFPFFTSREQWANDVFSSLSNKRFFLDTEASSPESVGEFWLWQVSEVVI